MRNTYLHVASLVDCNIGSPYVSQQLGFLVGLFLYFSVLFASG